MTTPRFDIQLYTLLAQLERKMRIAPLNLGGIAASGGGAGGPVGGFIGMLPQTRVTYDFSEDAISGWASANPYNASGILVSGSLLDNLNHIRYRITVLESGDIPGRIEVYDDGGFVASGITMIDFYDNLNVTKISDEKIRVDVADGGKVKNSSNDTTAGYLEDKIAEGSNVTITVLNEGANEQLQISSVGTFIDLTDTPSGYSGQSGKIPSVNGTEDGLNFITVFSGASHNPVTVADTATVDLTLTDQHLTASVIPGGVDHGSLAGLGDDDHTQYLTSGRHDDTSFHTLGTIVPHDSLNGLTDVTITSPAETEVLTYQGGNWVNAVTSGAHAPVTVDDTSTVNLTLAGQHLTADIVFSGVDHGNLQGLSDDDHTQYLNTARHDVQARHVLGTVVPHDTLQGLSNVTIAGLADNHIIRYNASTLQWENEADIGGDSAFTDLVDTPSGYSGYSGYTVVVKATEDGLEFVPASGVGGATTLSELTDVTIVSAVSGEVLKYNGSEWVNSVVSGVAGGATSFLNLTDTPSSYTGFEGYTVVVNSQGDGLTYLSTASGTTLYNQALFANEGDLTVSSNPLRIYNNFGGSRTITKVQLSVGTAPVGSAIIVDINKNGTTIFTTQANRPQIAASANSGSSTTIDVPNWAEGEYLTMDVDQIGSSTAGSNLVVHVVYSSVINSSQHDAVTVADTSTVDLTLSNQHLTADVLPEGINHAQIQNIGTKTHDQIDSHINDTTIHWTQGSIDHGNLAGLTDDDHTQYLNITRHDTTSRHALGGVVPHDYINLLQDVSLTSPLNEDILVYNGSQWENLTINDLEANVDHGNLTGLTDDDHTQYLNTARHDTTTRHTLGTVVPHDELNGLSDVTITSPSTDEVLTWNGAQWVNQVVSGAGGSGHDEVTVGDTASVNLTLVGQYLTAAVIPAGVDHGGLGGLTDDDHTQYLNNTRHDTTTRHTLGTVVPHDTLNGLTDVAITSPVIGQGLRYTAGGWENQEIVFSGGGVTTIQKNDIDIVTDVTTLNFEGNVNVIDEGGNRATVVVTVSGAGTLHDPVTVGDTSSIDFTLADQHITATVIAGGVDHDSLLNTHDLTTDIDHSTITNTHNLTTDIDHDLLTNTHNLTTDIDHGAITGLGDDDHTQYLNVARHDLTARHTLGSVVPHDTLNGLGDVTLSSPVSGHVLKYNGSNWLNSVTPDPGAGTFLELTDTPSSYAGEGDKYVVVNPGGTGLSFTASGSTYVLTIQEDDAQKATNVTTLNFEGTIDVLDEGGGKVTITASGAGGGASLSDLDPTEIDVTDTVASPGTGIYAARNDHLHSIVTSSNPTGATILASDSNGGLQLNRLGIGTAPTVSSGITISGGTIGHDVGGLIKFESTENEVQVLFDSVVTAKFTDEGGLVVGIDSDDETNTDHIKYTKIGDLNTTTQLGVEVELEQTVETTLNSVVGFGDVSTTTAGTTQNRFGFYSYTDTDGGIINTAYGLYSYAVTTSTDITTWAGAYIANQEIGGRFNTAYGLQIADIYGIYAYAIYTNDGIVSLGDNLEFRQSSSITTTAGNLTLSPALRTIVDSSLTVPNDGIYVGRTADAGAGNVGFTGALLSYKGGTAYSTYGFRELTAGIASTNFYGTAINGTGNYNVNTEFVGVPSNAKSLLLSIRINDSVGSFIAIGPTYAGRWCLNARVQRNNTEFPAQGTVPVNSGQIYIETDGELNECYLVCYGYTV